MFRNIIWDVDGTLFDTYPAITRAIKSALNDLGKDAPQALIAELVKQSISHCTAVLIDKYQPERGVLEQALERHFNRITIEESRPFPGVINLCQFILSIDGKNVIITHRGRKSTLELLDGYNLSGYFAGCITCDDGYPRKPDPSAFEAALDIYHLQRNETLTVGDRQIDMQAGQAAGLFSCFYGDGVDNIKVDLAISNFDELYEYLLKTR